MLTVALIVLASLTYLAVGAFVFGYITGSEEGWTKLQHGYDEPGPWFGAILWPLTVFMLFVLKHFAQFGWNRAKESSKARKVRIQIEEKIRVEQQRIQEEAESEIEEALRERTAG